MNIMIESRSCLLKLLQHCLILLLVLKSVEELLVIVCLFVSLLPSFFALLSWRFLSLFLTA